MKRNRQAMGWVVFQRTFFIYALGLALLAASVDSNRARLIHLDSLKPIEKYFEKFSESKISFYPERFKDGLNYFHKVLKALPEFQALAYSHLGFCYFYLGDHQKAEVMYQKAIELKPHLYTLPYDMAIMSLRKGDERGALQFLNNSATLLNSNEQFFLELFRQFQKMGKPEVTWSAQKFLKRLIEDKKQLPAIRNRIQSRLAASEDNNQSGTVDVNEGGQFRLHFNPLVANFLP